jgi:16S rRNA (adenine1518-N6/adenine1519-N6)-dimethyltransferase
LEKTINNNVRPKKQLGQHFLTDQRIAARIAALAAPTPEEKLLEIGPGKGILTQKLLTQWPNELEVIELDTEAVNYLRQQTWANTERLNILSADALMISWPTVPTVLAANLPYNISSPIFFKLLTYCAYFRRAVVMIQKEVADRIAALPGNKNYGILSVLMGAYYEVTKEIQVPAGAFFPPPKVQSTVISFTRKTVIPTIAFDAFKTVVKTAFNQRRKTLNNALRGLIPADLPAAIGQRRAETLSVSEFMELTALYLGSMGK